MIDGVGGMILGLQYSYTGRGWFSGAFWECFDAIIASTVYSDT